MLHITIYREPQVLYAPSPRRKRSKDPVTSSASIARTRTTVSDLCLCNEFDWFCTFTFDPKRFDSKDFNKCYRYMNNWTRHARERHSKHLLYLIVPELHKSGAIHFHALIKNFEGQFKPSGVFQNGREVYNIKHWHFGFSTAVRIDNQEAVSRYVRKYITKDMVLLPGRKRYFCSQGLARPSRSHNIALDFLKDLVPCDFYADSDAEHYVVKRSDIEALPCPAEELEQLLLAFQ